MLPASLGLPAHQQQATVRERDGVRGEVSPGLVTETKVARRPQADARDHRVDAQLGLIVRVPPDGVAAIAVQVRERRVEVMPSRCCQLRLQSHKLGDPRHSLHANPRPCVRHAVVCKPLMQARDIVAVAKHANLVLPPRDPLPERSEQPIGLARLKEVWDEL